MTPTLLTTTLLEGTTGQYSFTLVDGAGQGVDLAAVESLRLTLSDLDSQYRFRDDQDIFNANNGTITTDPGPPLTTTVVFALQPSDTVILNARRWVEYRTLQFTWEWNGGQRRGTHVVQFGIETLEMHP